MEEITAGEAAGIPSFDNFAWPLCADFRDLGTCFLAPRLPQSVVLSAFSTFLELASDEVLLAIFCARTGRGMIARCAVTTKRVYWEGDPRRDAGAPADPDRPAPQFEGLPPLRCEYLAYNDLPETIAITGVTAKVIDLGDGRQIKLGSEVRPLKALAAFLTNARSRVRGETPLLELSPIVREQFKRAWPTVIECDAKARAIEAELRKFHARTTAAKYAFVSRLITAACVVVFVVMVARGVSPIEPHTEDLWRWGATDGLSVVFNQQVWRLASSMFLHIGLFHLVMNMWGLLSAGPLVERFFGHVSFAVIYLLSGIGGSLASLVFQPLVTLAGASGAIFGIIGALLAFLLVRAGDVPLFILRPMRSGTLAFVGYSMVFGLIIPRISMAAHIGGLVTGFVVGLLLAMGKPGSVPQRIWRAVAIAGLTAAFYLLTTQAIAYTRTRLLADPEIGPRLLNQIQFIPEWIAFENAVQPALEDFDRIGRERSALQKKLSKESRPGPETIRALERLIRDSDALGRRLAVLPTGNNEIRAVNAKLMDAQSHLNTALVLLRRFIQTGEEKLLAGPDGFAANLKASNESIEEYLALRDAYEREHGIVRQSR